MTAVNTSTYGYASFAPRSFHRIRPVSGAFFELRLPHRVSLIPIRSISDVPLNDSSMKRCNRAPMVCPSFIVIVAQCVRFAQYIDHVAYRVLVVDALTTHGLHYYQVVVVVIDEDLFKFAAKVRCRCVAR